MTESLILKLQSGDEKAFEQIVMKYQHEIVNLSFRFTGNIADAEDIAQEVFIKVWNNIASFQGKSSFKTWIYRIALNTSLTYIRQKKTEAIVDMIGDALFMQSSSNDPYSSESEDKNMVRKAIRSLPKNQRIAVTLRTFQQMPYDQIAAIMRVSVSSVESLLFRAKKNMKKKLQKYYFSEY